jgi:hypothetical protein
MGLFKRRRVASIWFLVESTFIVNVYIIVLVFMYLPLGCCFTKSLVLGDKH